LFATAYFTKKATCHRKIIVQGCEDGTATQELNLIPILKILQCLFAERSATYLQFCDCKTDKHSLCNISSSFYHLEPTQQYS